MAKKRIKKQPSKLADLVRRYEQGQLLAQRLRDGENVELREIKAVLGADVVNYFKSMWEGQKATDEYERDKPAAIKHYEQMLRKADMLFGRAEKLAATADSRKGRGKVVNKAGIERMYRSAEQQYEWALEQLAADYSRDKTLKQHFDRPLDFGFGSALRPNRDSVPRFKLSRSGWRDRGNSFGRYDDETEKNEPKFASNKARSKYNAVASELEKLGETYAALENALNAIEQAKAEEAKQRAARIKEALARLKSVRR